MQNRRSVMTERRLFLLMSFGIIAALILISAVLIFFERGGAAQFDILGQEFSSTNIGIGVLFVAVSLFLFLLNRFTVKSNSTQDKNRTPYSAYGSDQISWDEMTQGINDLILQLTAANGFRPDLVVGLCGGGLMVADMVSKRLGHIPCVSLWANRHSENSKSPFGGQALKINRLALESIVKSNGIDRILLVDDVVYSGKILGAAHAFLNERSSSIRSGAVELKTASLFSLNGAEFKPDFTVFNSSNHRRMMPSSDRLRSANS